MFSPFYFQFFRFFFFKSNIIHNISNNIIADVNIDAILLILLAYFAVDYFAGKEIELAPVRRKKYEPSPLQQEYLDIQSSLEVGNCEEEDESDKKKKKKKK